MIVTVKYFHEKTDVDYEIYNKIWDDNITRLVFLHDNLSLPQQVSSIRNELESNGDKDILAIRFPLVPLSMIMDDVIQGKGVPREDGGAWYPKEVWIYGL
jgi:hypothetical protein